MKKYLSLLFAGLVLLYSPGSYAAAGDPLFEPGGTNITETGTITSGVWHGTAIDDLYLSSAATWNAKANGLAFYWVGRSTNAPSNAVNLGGGSFSTGLLKITVAGGIATPSTAVAADVPDLSTFYQPLDADLTYLAGFTPSANVKTILNAADYAAIKTALGYQSELSLVKGTYTNGYLCTYTTAGTLLDCNTNPATYQTALTYPVTGIAAPTAGNLVKWGVAGNTLADSLKIGTFTDTKWCSYSAAGGFECTQDAPAGGTTVATDTIWDAAGDLVVGTGANTASRLAKGTASQVLAMKSDASTVEWTSTIAPLASPTFTGTVTLPKTTEIQDTSADHQYVLAVSELTADRIVTLPLLTGADEFVFKDFAQTLTNKTLTSPVLTTPQINDTSSDHQYIFVASELVADRNVTLPLLGAADTFMFLTHHKAAYTDLNTGTEDNKYVTPDGFAASNFGKRVVELTVFDYTTDVATGNGKGYFIVPDELNGMNLVRVAATVITAGTTNSTTIAIYNLTDTQEMLSTLMAIETTETTTRTSAAPGVIDTTHDDVATGDVLRIDVDAASTTAPKGLIVEMVFALP